MSSVLNSWRQSLELALRRVAPRVLDQCEFDAVRALRALSGRALLAMDEALRRPTSYSDKVMRAASADDEAAADAHLFVASCNANGFIRERALTELRRFPSPLAFAAGLIRSTDWVPNVRSAGVLLVNDLLPRLAVPDIVRLLDLLVRLRSRMRVSQALWQDAIAPVLMTPAGLEALWTALRDPASSAELRRAAYEFLALGESGKLAEVLAAAAGDADPRIGLWALDRVQRLPDGEQSQRVLEVALRADHAAVRQTALRRYAATGAEEAADTLRAALFDVARGVRAFAAYELKRSHAEDALPAWRAAVESTDRRRSEVAVKALCEFGTASDVERLAAAYGRWNASTRVAVLRGLLRVISPQLESILAQAIFDRSKIVLRELSQVYRRGNISLDVALVDEAIARADDRLAPNLLSLGQLLGKWEEVEFLLRHALREHRVVAESAADRIDQWVQTESRRFTAPSARQLAQLPDLTRAAQARHPDRRWGTIHLALAAFATVP